MRLVISVLVLLALPCAAFANSAEIQKLNSWKESVQSQLTKDKGELGLWKQRMSNTVLVSAGKSPIGPTHMVPGQDPTIVSGWRDPMTKDDAADNFTEAVSHVQRLEGNIKAAEQELARVEKEIKKLENIERGGSGGGGGDGGGGGY